MGGWVSCYGFGNASSKLEAVWKMRYARMECIKKSDRIEVVLCL